MAGLTQTPAAKMKSVVHCNFCTPSARADRVLEVLDERTHTIQRRLSSFPPVLEDAVVAPDRWYCTEPSTGDLRYAPPACQPQHRPTVDVELESARAHVPACGAD